jgi:hypothetical protein
VTVGSYYKSDKVSLWNSRLPSHNSKPSADNKVYSNTPTDGYISTAKDKKQVDTTFEKDASDNTDDLGKAHSGIVYTYTSTYII